MKNVRIFVPAVLAIALLFLSACATTQTGTHTAQSVDPPPPSLADVRTSGELIADAAASLDAGRQLIDDGLYDDALGELLAGLAAVGALSDESDPTVRRTRDELVVRLGAASVRAVRLRDGFDGAAARPYPLDFQYNERVERWLNHWLTRGRRTIEVYLSRSGRYIDRVRAIVVEEGLPPELAYLPMIESGYSPMAHSRANAVGAWQFIRSTGKNYNLTIDGQVDERRDVEKATRSACAYLRRLHDQFGRWDLALAAYNQGENGLARAIAKQGTDDYWKLDLPIETEDYVPKFYATLMVAADPSYFGIAPQTEAPVDVRPVVVARPVDIKKLAEKTEVPYESIKEANPELLGRYTPTKATDYALMIPAEHYEGFAGVFAAMADSEKYLSTEQIRKVETGTAVVVHVVRKGDTLWNIAKKYRTTVDNIRRWNRLGRKSIIRPGQRLRIHRRV